MKTIGRVITSAIFLVLTGLMIAAAKAAGKSVGLRINPECSTQDGHAIYDPCAPGSRLGTTRAQWDAAAAENSALPGLLDGLHFHTLCEQDADALAVTLDAVAEKFGDLLPKMKWLNFGGGHHITRPDYDLADWVLGKFPPEDAKAIADRYPDLEAAAKLIMDGKLSLAQSKYNG